MNFSFIILKSPKDTKELSCIVIKQIKPYKPGAFYGTQGNRIAPDVTPQNVAFHLGLFTNFIEK